MYNNVLSVVIVSSPKARPGKTLASARSRRLRQVLARRGVEPTANYLILARGTQGESSGLVPWEKARASRCRDKKVEPAKN